MGNAAKLLDLEVPVAVKDENDLQAEIIVRAWKDESFAESLGTIARNLLPENPAGVIDLNRHRQELKTRENEIVANSYGGNCDSYGGQCSSYGGFCDSYGGQCYSYGGFCGTEASDCY